MIAYAVDLAERQLQEGTASAQVITHYLKLGSSREKLEQGLMEKKIELMEIQKETYQSQARVEAMYLDALNAMRRYSGSGVDDDEESQLSHGL